MNTVRLKTELLCRGARTDEGTDKERRGGAGPSGGRYFTLPSGTCVEIPLQGKFVATSPFTLVESDGRCRILRDGKTLVEVKPVLRPRFYKKKTSDGTPMSKIAVLHGADCLASTVYSRCIHWSGGKQCKFCGIELGRSARLTLKQPRQLGEVTEEGFNEGAVRHVTLTTGTPPVPDKGASMLAEATREIKEHVDVPVHVQLEPSRNARSLDALYRAGVDTVGIHIESFDPKVLTAVCPAKSHVEDYLESWKKAAKLFGEGQVSTFIIAGLGETDESILSGAEKAARMGVIPYLLPLRPITGTVFEKVRPPTPQRMMRLYRSVAESLHEVGLDPTKCIAGCVRCGACSTLREAYMSKPQ